MSYIYALIARSKKIILTDYTECTGNFPQIALMIVSKAKLDKKCSITYNEYNFYYHEENDLCYLLIGKNLKQEKAFGFLEDLRKKFLSCFDSDRIYTAFAFELKPFNEEIKKLMEFHQKNPKTKNELMRDALVESAVYIQESYEQLLDRDQKLTIISEKSQTANQNSFIFKDQARKLKEKERRNRIILYSIVGIIIVALIIILVISIS